MHTTRRELFFLLNEVFINECPPVIIKRSFSLRVCEVEQNNVPPVLVSDSHPQTTGFGAGGAFLLHDDKSSRAQQFMLIVANLCRVTIRAIFPRRVLASLWSWPAHTHTLLHRKESGLGIGDVVIRKKCDIVLYCSFRLFQ